MSDWEVIVKLRLKMFRLRHLVRVVSVISASLFCFDAVIAVNVKRAA
jgi:hypothetical protein